jgi:two-component system response regulator YesN
MYKLIIVEDEPLARHIIKALVLDNFDNIQVVGEAENGTEAVRLSKKYEPDIILMDIRIPGINGIEASKQILSEFPDVKILVLTAYDDFNYIQQALNMGVKGYLLKPFQDNEIIEKITEIINEIKDLDLNKKLESSINEVKPLIQKELVTAFISGDFDVHELKSYISFIGEEIQAGYFMLISYEGDSNSHIADALRNKRIGDKVHDIVYRFIPSMKKCLFGQTTANIIVIFFCEDSTSLSNINESENMAQDIKRKINVIAGTDVSIGIGEVYSGLINLRLSYFEAFEALKKAKLNNNIIHFAKIKDELSSEIQYEYPVKIENEMLEYIRIGQVSKALESADTIISDIFKNCSDSILIKDYIVQLITIIKRTLQQIGINKNSLNIIGILMDTSIIHSLNELNIWSKNNIFALIHLADEQSRQKDLTVIERIITYINNNFCSDITLDAIAEEVNLSPQYVSRIFRDQLGENFVDYFTRKRIEYAKEILVSETKSISEISTSVGYSDVNYFCRVFKKVTGLTPKQYKLKNLT